MLNKFSCKISGKPSGTELRFGNTYNSKNILISLEQGKHYKVKNSFNSVSEITLVNSKNNTYRLVYVANKGEIPLQEGDDGISSVRLYLDTNTTYDNEIVTCLIYTQEDDDFIPGQTDYILNIQQEMLEGDYFVKEADGWKEVHNWNKRILTGDESYNNNVNYINIGRFGIYFSLAAEPGSITNPNAISNYYKSEFAVENGNVYVSGVDGAVYMINENFKGDLEGFKQQLRLYYQENKAVYIYYVLKTPTKLSCTEEQSAVLDELNNLDLFEGVNNIITAENIAKLKLKYVADTKTYVDNQVNERLSNIENQIINLSGGN